MAFQNSPQDPPIQQAWTVDFEDVILGTPTAHGDLVFAASKDGKVRAFKADTGEPEWWFDAKVPVLSNLVVFKDRLFVPGVTRSTVLDLKTGKVLRDELPSASRVVVSPSRLYLLDGLTWEAERLHYGSSRSVSAVDPVTGKTAWQEKIPNPGATTAIESGGRLYLPGQHLILALDGATGNLVGESHDFRIVGSFHGTADKERIFLFPGGEKAILCLNKKTLKEQWSGSVKADIRVIPPIQLPDRLILFGLPKVVAIDLKAGKELWTVALEGAPDFSTTPPAMRGSEICVGSRGVLYGIDAAAGKATWTLRTVVPDKLPNVAQPGWVGDRLLYAVGRKLMCFKPKDR